MKRYIPFALFFIFILWVIAQADTNGTNYFFTWVAHIPLKDKMGHFMLYGILALLLDNALKYSNWQFRHIKVAKAVLLVLVFAIVEEIAQVWIPARNFDLKDALADVLGVCSMVYGFRWIRGKLYPNSKVTS